MKSPQRPHLFRSIAFLLVLTAVVLGFAPSRYASNSGDARHIHLPKWSIGLCYPQHMTAKTQARQDMVVDSRLKFEGVTGYFYSRQSGC